MTKLNAHLFTKDDLPFWKELYADPEVKRQMYALPSFTDDELLEYLLPDSSNVTQVVTMNGKPIGGFTIRKETATRGTFGIVIQKKYRKRGLSLEIMKLLEAKASKMRLAVLRADVYADNLASIKMLEQNGFRPFIWFEKNL
jgi:RimJ/RimL family protein N-acetyltransferase